MSATLLPLDQTPTQRAVFAPLVLTLFVFISVGLLIPLTTTTVVDRLHEPKKFIGYAIGAMTIGAFCGRLIGGALIDSFGTRFGLRIAATFVVIGGLIYIIPVSMPTFLAARFLHGLGEAMVYTCAATLVVSNVPNERRSRYLGLLGSAVWGGLSIGPALAETITRIEAAGVFTAIAGVALLVVAQLVGKATTATGAAITTTATTATTATGAAITTGAATEQPRPQRRLRPNFPRPALAPAVCVGCYNLGYAAITGFLILHLRANQIEPKHALSFYAFAVLFGRVALGGIPDRLGPRPSLIAGLTAMFVALGVISLAPSQLVVRSALVLFGIGYSMPFPALASIAVDRTRETERASTVATLGIVYDVFVFLASVLFGWMADADWLQEVFWVGMVGIAAGFGIALRITAASSNRSTAAVPASRRPPCIP
jgi:MFS family permease